MKNVISAIKIKYGNYKKRYANVYKGRMALMCPYCKNITFLNLDYKLKYELDSNLECHILTAGLYDLFAGKCIKCKNYTKYITLDGNIGKVIQKFISKGYMTKFCCEGHKHYKKYETTLAYISFDNGLDYLDNIKEYLPDSWYIDEEDLEQNKLIIRAKKDVSLDKRINDIRKMARQIKVYR